MNEPDDHLEDILSELKEIHGLLADMYDLFERIRKENAR